MTMPAVYVTGKENRTISKLEATQVEIRGAVTQPPSHTVGLKEVYLYGLPCQSHSAGQSIMVLWSRVNTTQVETASTEVTKLSTPTPK